ISIAERGAASEAPGDRGDVSTRPDLEIVGMLGEGGMGLVHLARQRSLGRDVAIKVVRPDAWDPRAAKALVDEATVMGHLEHPGIIPVHALGVDDRARPLLVMKRVEGVTWNELLRDPAHLAWARLDAPEGGQLAANVGVLMAVCNALAFAHRCGIV